ncbi:hypothetical protein PQQ65_06865 [Paraburkholderia strydomiana]|uniref:hypothetical protein n=1 Tax=Paraburkholderia strydomiana TaxID=1245417 RepID=UPI0038B8A3C1
MRTTPMQRACAMHHAGNANEANEANEANQGDEERECPDLAIDAPCSVAFDVR